MDRIRIGLVFYSAGQRVAVEKGFQTIGHTSYETKYGQVFWFKSVADFERDKKDIFETVRRNDFPVPVFEMIEPPVSKEKVESALEPKEAMAPPANTFLPPPPLDKSADDIFRAFQELQIKLGHKFRVSDLASEIEMDAEKLETIIRSDSRYASIVAGWVNIAETS